jgi:hypothetical protein
MSDDVEAARYLARRPVGDLFSAANTNPTESSTPLTHEVPVRAHLRTLPGDAPPSGEARRDAVLEAFDGEDAVQVAKRYVQRELAALYRERDTAFRIGARSEIPYVTADDADAVLCRWPQRPKALDERGNNWRGALLRGGGWYRIAGKVVRSHRDRMNSTDLACWALREAA